MVDPSARLTATQALQDPWMVGVDMPAVDLKASCEHLSMLSSEFDDYDEEGDDEDMGEAVPPSGSPSAAPDV